MKAADLRDMDVDTTLQARAQEIDDQLFRMRIQKSMGQFEAPGRVRDAGASGRRFSRILKEKAK